MERQAHLRELFNKYLSGNFSPHELEELLQHFDVREDEDMLTQLIADAVNNFPTQLEHDELITRIGDNVEKRLFRLTRPKSTFKKMLPYISIAALLVAVALLAYIFYAHPGNGQYQDIAAGKTNDVAPGTQTAVLTLANGKKISLKDAANGQIAIQAGIIINKAANGQLVYTVSNQPTANINVYNTIETPRGGEYQVILPDGTKVWLNAASSLKYPASFTALKARQVELSGEAYFEVAHNKAMPFRVKTAKQLVQVLGTHFNVMAYTDEATSNTTLLQGSVKVSTGKSTRIIIPGQQATVQEDITVQEADTDAVLAWKNGQTYFKHANIPTMMRALARWYNIEVVYEGGIPTGQFTGGISRSSNLSSMIRILELNNIHASIQSRKLIIKP